MPPTTIPATTVKVRVSSLVACALSTREASIAPASAAAPPLSMKLITRT